MKCRFLGAICVSALLSGAAFLPACSDDGEASGGTSSVGAPVTFTGESELFPGLDYSTGLLPEGSPVQASFSVTATGAATIAAEAFPSGSAASPTLTGTPGTGALAIDGGFALLGNLKVDITGLPKYDGDIPGLENVSIPVEGAASFDPFSIDTPVSVTAQIPASKLPSIPLPGGIPGQIVLEVAEGSYVEATFAGVCAGVEGTEAAYSAVVSRAGSLIINPSIEIDVPLMGTEVFEIPSFTVDLNLGSSDVDMTAPVTGFGAQPATGDHQSGTCDPQGTGGSAGASGAGGSAGASGTGGSAGASGTGGTGTGGTSGTGGTGTGGTSGTGGTGTGGTGTGGTSGTGGTGGTGLVGSATVEIDGTAMNVTQMTLWSPATSGDPTDVFIDFTGPGFSTGSDIHITIAEAGAGCAQGNTLWLRPDASSASYPSQYTPDDTAGCGLLVSSVPTQAGELASGTFNGWLDATDSSSQVVQLSLTFDVPWE